MTFRALSWALATLTLVVASPSPAQTGQPYVSRAEDAVFQARANAVRLDVRVVDANGRFVQGLTREDFTVVDEGVTQEIAQCVLIDRPPPAATVRSDLRADAASNRGAAEGRLYAIVFDDLHIDASRLVTARQIARQFIERYLEDNDRVAIGTTSGNGWVSHEFSNNRASLLDAVEQLEATSGDDSLALRGLSAFVDFLSSIPERRKSILFISEGLGLDTSSSASVRDLRTVSNASATANAVFYPVDPRGDPGSPFTTIKPAPTERSRLFGYERSGRRNLEKLAEATGGMALIGSNMFTASFERIVSDNSTYYLLGYVPAPTKTGRRHEVRVTVNRPSVTVQSRHAYPDPESPPRPRGAPAPRGLDKALGGILQSPVPLTGLSMDVTAAAFEGSRSRHQVTVVVEVGGSSAGAIDIVVAAIAAERPAKDFEKSAIELHPTREGDSESRGRFVTTLMLPPGRYHLRAAAVRRDKTASGSVLHDFWVPDFQQSSLILSDLLVASDPWRGREVEGPDPSMEPPPLARRVFRRSETLTISGELSGRDVKAARTLDLQAFISSADGGIVRESGITPLQLPAGKARLPFSAMLPLDGLAPGRYVLDLEAKTTGAVRQNRLQRRIPFVIQ